MPSSDVATAPRPRAAPARRGVGLAGRGAEAGSYLLLFLMMAPTLLWILVNRGMWPSDSCPYGELALELSSARGSDAVRWWEKMLTIGGFRPPLLPWVSQLFVPLGRWLGNVDAGLLLVPFAAHYAALVFTFRSARTAFESRGLALLGCLVLASTPLFIGVGKELAVQPLQLMTVSWFLYVATQSRRWDGTTVLLHLVAASATALLTMLSTPAFCVVLGLAALLEVQRRGWAGIVWKRSHAPMALLSVALVLPGAAWYAVNAEDTFIYAQSAYRTPWVARVEDVFLAKLGQWVDFIWHGAFFLPAIGLVASAVVAWALLRRRDGDETTRTAARVAAVVAAQMLFALVVHAGSSQQLYRYSLPFSLYIAFIATWAVFRIRKRWVTGAVAVTFALQWALVHAGDLQLSKMERKYWAPPFTTTRPPELDFIDVIVETTFDAPGSVILELRALGLDAGHVTYHAWKQPDYARRALLGEVPTVRSIDMILTSEEGQGRTDRAWDALLERRPDFVVVPNEAIRRRFLQAATGDYDTSRLADRRSLAVVERLARSPRFERVPAPTAPEIEIYRLR